VTSRLFFRRGSLMADIEHLALDARVQRLAELAGYIEHALREGPMPLRELFTTVSREQKVAVAQVKYGLTYAKGARNSVCVSPQGIAFLASAR
jgi:hypothetical protein